MRLGEGRSAIPSRDGSCLVVTRHCWPTTKAGRLPMRPGGQGTTCLVLAKPWVVSKARSGLPFPTELQFCVLGVHPCPGSSMVRVGMTAWVVRSQFGTLTGVLLDPCLLGIASLTAFKSSGTPSPAGSFSGCYNPVNFPSCSVESVT